MFCVKIPYIFDIIKRIESKKESFAFNSKPMH